MLICRLRRRRCWKKMTCTHVSAWRRPEYGWADAVWNIARRFCYCFPGHLRRESLKLPWMYLTTLTLRPCLEIVMSTSPALFLHGRLWGGHQDVMALKSSCRSSFCASSSAGDTKLHSFTKIWEQMRQKSKTFLQNRPPLLWGKYRAKSPGWSI